MRDERCVRVLRAELASRPRPQTREISSCAHSFHLIIAGGGGLCQTSRASSDLKQVITALPLSTF